MSRTVDRVTVLCGGVGGARMARALSAVLPGDHLTAVVNVGDDDDVYGVRVCADLDTVLSTLAGMEGPHGWGIAGDTFHVLDALGALGVDTTFRLGDRDLARCLHRTSLLDQGVPLSAVTARSCAALGIDIGVLPVTDDAVRTRVRTTDGDWLAFQDYFVLRGHRDEIDSVRVVGADASVPAPGVIESVASADIVVIAPSNPLLSIWPILAVPGIRAAVAGHPRVVAVSPLFSGKALKGPADRVLASNGFPSGTAGIVAAYDGLLDHLVIDIADAADADAHTGSGLRVHALDTRIAQPEAGVRFASRLLEIVAAS